MLDGIRTMIHPYCFQLLTGELGQALIGICLKWFGTEECWTIPIHRTKGVTLICAHLCRHTRVTSPPNSAAGPSLSSRLKSVQVLKAKRS